MAITQGSVGAGGGGGGGSVDPTAPNAVELSDGTAYYVAAKDTTLAGVLTTADFDTKVGSLTETAPATDTGSSGLNGRLQRLAERFTSLIALLPAALVGGRLDVNIGAAPAAVTLGTGSATIGNVGVNKVPGTVSTANSSTAALLANAVFTGTSEDVSGYAAIAVSVFADQAGTLSPQFSSDGTHWDFVGTHAITASTGAVFVFRPGTQFWRVVYTNGGTNQTTFRLQTVYHLDDIDIATVQALGAGLSNPTTEMVGADLMVQTGGGTSWAPAKADSSNRLVFASDDGSQATFGAQADGAASSDTGTASFMALFKRHLQRLTTLIGQLPTALVSGRLDVNLGAAPAAVTLGAGAAAVGTVGVTGNVTAADRTASGAVAATNANVALTPNGCGTVTAAIATNASWNGTLTFQGTTDGTNWLAIAATNVNTGAFGQTYATGNTNALFQLNVAALSQVRVIALTYSAGSATVTLEGSSGSSCFPGLLDSAGRSQVVGAAAAGAAVAGNPVRQGISDGTNTQDCKQYVQGNTGQAVTGIPAVGVMLTNLGGSNSIPLAGNAPVDGVGTNIIGALAIAARYSYNGTNLDRDRNNTDVILLSSAARTTTQTSADITTYNNLGIVLTTDITAISGGQTITTTINGKDPSSGKYYLILSSTAYAATGTNVLRVVPGLTASPNLTANDHLPRVIQIVTTLGNGVSTTYGVGYTLLV